MSVMAIFSSYLFMVLKLTISKRMSVVEANCSGLFGLEATETPMI